jgi:uncharacterized protein YbjT (DUF2867 family)
MRIAVIGGTGVIGRHTVEALRRSRHDTVVIARSRGVDISSGQGLEDALVGVGTVIDVTNLQAPDGEATRNLFAAATRNLLAAEQRAQVRHHVLLSLVDMARPTLAARGESIRLIPSWRSGLFGGDAAGEVLLPGPEARLAPTTFDAWLIGQSATVPSGS